MTLDEMNESPTPMALFRGNSLEGNRAANAPQEDVHGGCGGRIMNHNPFLNLKESLIEPVAVVAAGSSTSNTTVGTSIEDYVPSNNVEVEVNSNPMLPRTVLFSSRGGDDTTNSNTTSITTSRMGNNHTVFRQDTTAAASDDNDDDDDDDTIITETIATDAEDSFEISPVPSSPTASCRPSSSTIKTCHPHQFTPKRKSFRDYNTTTTSSMTTPFHKRSISRKRTSSDLNQVTFPSFKTKSHSSTSTTTTTTTSTTTTANGTIAPPLCPSTYHNIMMSTPHKDSTTNGGIGTIGGIGTTGTSSSASFRGMEEPLTSFDSLDSNTTNGTATSSLTYNNNNNTSNNHNQYYPPHSHSQFHFTNNDNDTITNMDNNIGLPPSTRNDLFKFTGSPIIEVNVNRTRHGHTGGHHTGDGHTSHYQDGEYEEQEEEEEEATICCTDEEDACDASFSSMNFSNKIRRLNLDCNAGNGTGTATGTNTGNGNGANGNAGTNDCSFHEEAALDTSITHSTNNHSITHSTTPTQNSPTNSPRKTSFTEMLEIENDVAQEEQEILLKPEFNSTPTPLDFTSPSDFTSPGVHSSGGGTTHHGYGTTPGHYGTTHATDIDSTIRSSNKRFGINNTTTNTSTITSSSIFKNEDVSPNDVMSFPPPLNSKETPTPPSPPIGESFFATPPVTNKKSFCEDFNGNGNENNNTTTPYSSSSSYSSSYQYQSLSTWRSRMPPQTPLLDRKVKRRSLSPLMDHHSTNTTILNDNDGMDTSINSTNTNGTCGTSGTTATTTTIERSRFDTDFDVQGTLGHGSFGTVYKCQCRLDGCTYAVKAVKRQAKGKADRDRMLKEVYALATLCDRSDVAAFHIVRYHQAWMEENCTRLYIQTELCTSTLSDELKMDGTKNIKRCPTRQYKMVREVLLALDLIHRNGMCHLDIKPENIFIKGENFKLGDFGLVAKASSGDVEEGDCRYMCMDLLSGNGGDLTKCDIFSLGASIYEVVRNQPLPAEGQEWQDIRAGKLKSMGENTPAQLQQIIKDMLHPNAQERPTAAKLLTRSELLSEEQKQLHLEKRKVHEANMALAAQAARLKKLLPTTGRRGLLLRSSTCPR